MLTLLNYLSRISQVYILHVQCFVIAKSASTAIMHNGAAVYENPRLRLDLPNFIFMFSVGH